MGMHGNEVAGCFFFGKGCAGRIASTRLGCVFFDLFSSNNVNLEKISSVQLNSV